MKQNVVNGAWALAARTKRNLNQKDFWTPLGVTQSGGSRYECGRAINKVIANLLLIAYGTPQDTAKVLGAIRINARTAGANSRKSTKEAVMAKATKPAKPAKPAPAKKPSKKGC